MARAVVLTLALVSVGCAAAAPPDPDTAVVAAVVDGDTLTVEVGGVRERVRLLGIDTPESVDPRRPVECFGPEASALLHHLAPEGTAVRLERDTEARDRYGRLLAYVFRRDDGLFLNEAMAAAGAAEVLVIAPNGAYRDRIAAAVTRAQRARAGQWGAC